MNTSLTTVAAPIDASREQWIAHPNGRSFTHPHPGLAGFSIEQISPRRFGAVGPVDGIGAQLGVAKNFDGAVALIASCLG